MAETARRGAGAGGGHVSWRRPFARVEAQQEQVRAQLQRARENVAIRRRQVQVLHDQAVAHAETAVRVLPVVQNADAVARKAAVSALVHTMSSLRAGVARQDSELATKAQQAMAAARRGVVESENAVKVTMRVFYPESTADWREQALVVAQHEAQDRVQTLATARQRFAAEASALDRESTEIDEEQEACDAMSPEMVLLSSVMERVDELSVQVMLMTTPEARAAAITLGHRLRDMKGREFFDKGDVHVFEDDDVSTVLAFVNEAVIPRSHRAGNAAVVQEVCAALERLCNNRTNLGPLGDVGVCEAIVKHGLIPHLNDACMVQKVCGVIWRLAFEEQDKKRLFDAGAGQAILDALQRHGRENPDMASWACCALGNIACHSETRGPLGDAGACEVVLDHALIPHGKTNMEAARLASHALARLLLDGENKRRLKQHSDIWEVVVTHALVPHVCEARVVQNVCDVIWRLLDVWQDDNQKRLFDAGAGQAIVDALRRNGQQNPDMAHTACEALGRIACHSETRRPLGEAGACEVVLDHVLIPHGKTNADTAHRASFVLAQLSLDTANRYRLKQRNGAALIRAHTSHPDNSQVRYWSEKCLTELAKI